MENKIIKLKNKIKKNNWEWIIKITFKLGLILFGILGFLDYFSDTSIILKSSSDLILFLTFLAILWYSFETSEMKKQIIEQNKLSICPFVTVYYNKDEKTFKVKNIGNGVALNIEFPKVKIEDCYMDLEIQEPSLLATGEEKEILFCGLGDKKLSKDERKTSEEIEDRELTMVLKKDCEVIIEFQDIRKNKYKSKFMLIYSKTKGNYKSKYLSFKIL